MPETTFTWSPVTFERPRQNIMWIAIEAHYDDDVKVLTIDDEYQGRMFKVGAVDANNAQEFRWRSEGFDEPMSIRPTRPDDALRWDRSLRIPLPTEIIGAILTHATPPPTLSAAVDDLGDVQTMILETGLGLYARYSSSWILMTDISPIEQLGIVDVVADDLAVYDDADNRGETVNLADLHPIERPAVSAVAPGSPEQPTASTASAAPGTVIVASFADLPDAIAYAATASGTGSRWYVARRARSLGWTEPLPWAEDGEW
jgi:hypothetical protein